MIFVINLCKVFVIVEIVVHRSRIFFVLVQFSQHEITLNPPDGVPGGFLVIIYVFFLFGTQFSSLNTPKKMGFSYLKRWDFYS